MTEAGKVTVPVELDGKGAESGADSLLASLGEKFGKLKDVLAFAGVGLGVAEIGKQLFDIGEEFSNAQHIIQRATGATGDSLSHLVDISHKVATDVPASFADAATAVSELRQRLDVGGKALRNITDQVIALSKVTGQDLNSTIDESTQVLQRWNIPIGKSRDALNVLFRASQKTGVQFGDLAQSTANSATVMKGLGFNFDQTAVIMARLSHTGVNTTTIMSGLRTGLAKLTKGSLDTQGATVKLQDATQKAGEALSKYGVHSQKYVDALNKEHEAEAKLSLARAGHDPQKFFESFVKQLQSAKTAADATGLAVSVFGSRAGPELARAARTGAFATDQLSKAIVNGNETIRKTEEQTRSFGDEWQIFSNKVKLAVEPLATTVLAHLNTALQFVGDNIGTVVKAGHTFASLMQGIPGKIALIGGAAAGGAEAVTLITDAVNGAVEAFRTLRDAEIVAFIASNPLAAVAGVIAGVGAAIILFGNHTSDVAKAEGEARTATNLLAQALHDLKSAALNVQESQLRVKQDALDLADAQDTARKALQKYGPASEQYKRAAFEVHQSDLVLRGDKIQLADAEHTHFVAQQKSVKETQNQLKAVGDLATATRRATGFDLAFNQQHGRTTSGVHRLADAVAQYTQHLGDMLRQGEATVAQGKRSFNPQMVQAGKLMEEAALTGLDLTKKIHNIPTQKQINVFYKTNPGLLAQQANHLRDSINGIPLSHHPDLSINWGTPPPSWWHRVFPHTPGAAPPIGGGAAQGAVVSRPTVMLVGENPSTSPEVISPVKMLRQIVREEAGGGGVGEVRVFIGNQELTDIVRTEVVSHDRASATRVRAGRLFGGAG